MTAEQYLEQIQKLDVIIINKLADYNRWVAIAGGLGGVSVGDRVQSSRNLQRGSDAIGRYIDIEREIDALKQKRLDIIKTVEQLPPIEYDLIYRLYVQGHSLKEIAYHFDKSYDWVKKRKRKALGMVQKLIDEKGG